MACIKRLGSQMWFYVGEGKDRCCNELDSITNCDRLSIDKLNAPWHAVCVATACRQQPLKPPNPMSPILFTRTVAPQVWSGWLSVIGGGLELLYSWAASDDAQSDSLAGIAMLSLVEV